MNNYKINILIKPDDIYNKLSPEDKKRFKDVMITNAILLDDGSIKIGCLLTEDKPKDVEFIQLFCSDGYLTVE